MRTLMIVEKKRDVKAVKITPEPVLTQYKQCGCFGTRPLMLAMGPGRSHPIAYPSLAPMGGGAIYPCPFLAIPVTSGLGPTWWRSCSELLCSDLSFCVCVNL